MKIISFIIISFNRPKETVESIKNIYFDLNKTDGYEYDLIVINNGSNVAYDEVDNYIKENNLKLQYINSSKNLGVSGGRNLGLSYVRGEYVAFIDDDAEFKMLDTPSLIVEKFKKYPDAGIIGFAVHNYFSGEEDLPVKDKKKLKQNEFYNNLFWGGAFVMKTNVYRTIGGFDDSFFYGMEEYDYAYRTMDKGFKILFTKEIVVLHKVSPYGREKNIVKFRRSLINKTIIAYRFLPIEYVFTHYCMWSLYFLRKSGFNVINWLSATAELLKKIKKEKRRPIGKSTLSYIHTVKGRLWY